jgi:hypothetical protein
MVPTKTNSSALTINATTAIGRPLGRVTAKMDVPKAIGVLANIRLGPSQVSGCPQQNVMANPRPTTGMPQRNNATHATMIILRGSPRFAWGAKKCERTVSCPQFSGLEGGWA